MSFAKRSAEIAALTAVACLALGQDQEPPVQNVPEKPKQQRSQTVEKWFRENIAQRIQVSGFRRLGFHSHQVTGDTDAYNITTNFGQGGRRFTDIGSLQVSGRNVAGLFNFDLAIQDSRFQDPQGEKLSLDYRRGPWEASLGDIQGSLLNTNQFARFQKTLRGASVGYQAKGFQIKALTTQVRGEPRTITLPGANTPGPYFLQSNQIVRGSERVAVDGAPQEFGRDYTIDYDLGAITFVNRQTLEGKIISPTSSIVVTYEAFGFTGQSGTLAAAGASFDMGRAGKIGLTAMAQRAGGANRLSTRLESFQGFGAAGTPYVLQFQPLLGSPIVVRLDGVVQAEGIDYLFDPDNQAIFYFTRFVPGTSQIDVLYTPRPTSTVNGDRTTLGIDYQLPFGRSSGGKFLRDGAITFSVAAGRLTNTPTPQSGVARGVEARWRQGRWELGASYRDVPSSFVGIETIGFNRNEKAHTVQAAYRPSERMTYSLQASNSAISQTVQNADGSNRIIPTRFTRLGASLESLPGGRSLPWTLSHIRTSGRNSLGETQLDATRLGVSLTRGKFNTSLGLQNQFGFGPVSGVAGSRQNVETQGLEARAAYSPNSTWSAAFSTNLNRIRTGGQTGFGRDLQLGLTWRPNEQFSSALQAVDSDAGSITSLGGFSTGYGYGYDGNGFSGGAGGNAILGASTFRRITWSNNWRPSESLSFGLGASLYRSEGSVTSNTETSSILLGVDWDAGIASRINATLGLDQTKSLGSGFRSRATNVSLNWTGAPGPRWSYNLGLSALLTGGSGEFSQDVFNGDFSLSYRLAQRHSLSLIAMIGQTRGYLPQDAREASLTYRYQIWRSLALNVSYTWRSVQNRDASITSGAFQSRGFDFELAFNFGT